MRMLLKVIYFTLISLSILYFITFYIYVNKVTNKLGFKPTYNHPDSSNFNFYRDHEFLVFILYFASYISLLITIVGLLYNKVKSRELFGIPDYFNICGFIIAVLAFVHPLHNSVWHWIID